MNIALIFEPGMMLEEASPVFLLTLLAKSALLKGKKKEFVSKQLFWLKTAAFPCRWLIQVQWAGRGGIRLWALSVNHTALRRRRHLSPNTKGSAPQGTLKPISSLTCNPSRSRKNRIVESYHIHFHYARGCSEEREQRVQKLYEETLGYVLGKLPPYFSPQMTDDALHWGTFTFLYLHAEVLLCSCFTAAWTVGSYVNLITSIISTLSSGEMEWNIVPLIFLLNNSQNWSMGSQHRPPSVPECCV